MLFSPFSDESQCAGNGNNQHAFLPSMHLRWVFIVILFSSFAARSEPASIDIVNSTDCYPTASSGLHPPSCPSCTDLFSRLETTIEGERVQDTRIQLRGGECTIRRLGKAISPLFITNKPSKSTTYFLRVIPPSLFSRQAFL